MAQPTEILKGTLGLLILRTLELEPRHGVAIAERIGQITKGTFHVEGRIAVSRAPSPRAGGLHRRRVDADRRRPAHQVLPADGGGPAAARRRKETVGAHRLRRGPGARIATEARMPLLPKIASYWRTLTRGRRLDARSRRRAARPASREIDCQEHRRRASTLTPHAVWRSCEVGGLDRVKEEVRDVRASAALTEETLRDICVCLADAAQGAGLYARRRHHARRSASAPIRRSSAWCTRCSSRRCRMRIQSGWYSCGPIRRRKGIRARRSRVRS